ncbi:MAG: PrsW family intramembrane metalloprotease [Lachnospiraceae bacterium]|nr:PrsW family intramembrane metalloprotease [Lachnospiraceae bacterium]
MLLLIGALLVSFIFPLAIYFFLRSAHKEDKDYKTDCRKLLLKGMLLGFPVFGFSLLCSIIFSLTHLSDKYPLINTLFRTFVLMAFSEELMKYLLAKATIKKNLSGVSFLDLMAYTTIAAIGFEILESVVYLFSANVPQILVRGVTSMHASFGLIMGYFLARGIKKKGKLTMIPAVLISTLIHGAYDFLLEPPLFDTGWGDLALLIALFCLVLNICNFFFMSKARKKTYYTEPLFPDAAGPAEQLSCAE